MTENQIDKIKGVFFGQAIGDALGLGTEFMNKIKIKEIYPEGISDYSQIIQDKHRSRWVIGDWTDDTDQFLCIVDSILEEHEITETGFAKQLFKWFKGVPMGIGNTVLSVVTIPQFTKYPHKASEYAWKASKYNNASNGAIMRTSALGIWEFWDLEKVIRNTETVCKVTHFDPRCVGSCVIVNSIISKLINTSELLSEQEITIIGEKYDQRINEYINKSKSTLIDSLQLDEIESIGYTLKALSSALWSYFNAKSFEDGLLQVVNQGGDADTNAAVSCSLLGAKFGYENIPKKYVGNLVHKELLHEKTNLLIKELKTNYAQHSV